MAAATAPDPPSALLPTLRTQPLPPHPTVPTKLSVLVDAIDMFENSEEQMVNDCSRHSIPEEEDETFEMREAEIIHKNKVIKCFIPKNYQLIYNNQLSRIKTGYNEMQQLKKK